MQNVRCEHDTLFKCIKFKIQLSYFTLQTTIDKQHKDSDNHKMFLNKGLFVEYY